MCKNESVIWRIAAANSACLSLLLAVLMASLLLEGAHAQRSRDHGATIQAFRDRFLQISGEELIELWHSDCHRRCRSALLTHVNLACIYDPYKIIKRRMLKREVNATLQHIIKDMENATSTTTAVAEPDSAPASGSSASASSPPFLAKTRAATFFSPISKGRTAPVLLRRRKRGIMDECCYSKACSWEEYAEFCHTSNRRPAERNTQCYT